MSSDHKIDYKYLLNQLLTGNLSKTEKDQLQEFILNSYQDSELNNLMNEHWTGMKNKEIDADEIQILNLKKQILTKINQVENTSKRFSICIYPDATKNGNDESCIRLYNKWLLINARIPQIILKVLHFFMHFRSQDQNCTHEKFIYTFAYAIN